MASNCDLIYRAIEFPFISLGYNNYPKTLDELLNVIETICSREYRLKKKN